MRESKGFTSGQRKKVIYGEEK